jgi:hypothetical protein
MRTAIFVTQFVPRDVGQGGDHRAYQILFDLEKALGKNNVKLISFPQWVQENPPLRPNSNFVTYVAREVKRRFSYYRENPVRILANTVYTPTRFSISEFLAHYQQKMKDIPKPTVCIIEHTGFAELIRLNSQYGIPSVSCIQNLEAFDTASVEDQFPRHMLPRVFDFANEFRVLAQCVERLFISKVETGLIGGLGLSAQYYPYVPVGLIRRRLEYIRRRRAETRIERGLFLLLGSAGHLSTRASFLWFMRQVQIHGLPDGVRIVVAGLKTDALLSPGIQVPGLEFRGWVQQDELDHLLMSTQGILMPQRVGFGALTRFSELSCAGIPGIVSMHPTYAVDLPPGIEVVDDEWGAWYRAMERSIKDDRRIITGYRKWERAQPRTLETVVGKMTGSRS